MPTACTAEYDEKDFEECLAAFMSRSHRGLDGETEWCTRFVAEARQIFSDLRAGRGEIVRGRMKRPYTQQCRSELLRAALDKRESLRYARKQLAARGDGHRYPELQSDLLRLYRRQKGVLIIQEAAVERVHMHSQSDLFRQFGLREFDEHGPN